MSKDYSYSKWYRTGNLRVVPSWFGFLRAEEEWRRDRYNNYTGLNCQFNLKWRSVGKLPQMVENNFYSYACVGHYEGEDEYRSKWRSFITWLGGMGIKDPVPQSPAENARFHRNLKRQSDKEQEEQDKRPIDGE